MRLRLQAGIGTISYNWLKLWSRIGLATAYNHASMKKEQVFERVFPGVGAALAALARHS